MKNLFAIIIVLFAIKCYSQSTSQSYYKRMFDTKGFNTWVSHSTSSNQLEFSWAVPAHMEALVLMYEKTKDTTYAKTLIECFVNTIDRRDDLRFPTLGLPIIYDYRGESGAAWSTNYYNKKQNSGPAHSHLVHSANITYPMAKFAAMVKLDPSIQNLKYRLQGRYKNKSYDIIADDLIQKVDETLEYHKDQWYEEVNSNDTIGYYKERDNDSLSYPEVILPYNMQSAVGRVLVQMHRATKEGNQGKYLKKLNKIAKFIKANTQFNPLLGSNIWTYWKFDTLREDISHSNLTASFPYECNKYGIVKDGIPIYTTSDMEAYYKTFTKDIYISPLVIKNGVNYNDENWDIKDDEIVPPNPPTRPRYGTYTAYMWLYLSQYDDQTLYQTVADLQAAKHYYDSITVDESSITLALMSNFENLIVPINTDHKYGRNSDWRGVAKGNFDGDDEEEFVVIRNIDGMMETLEPYNKGFRPVTNNKIYSGSNNWKGLAAGDFFGDGKSEIIALNDHADANENGFYILKIENNNLVEQSRYTGYGAQSEWTGIAAGNYISGGKDDVVAVRNFDKTVFVYQFNGSTFQSVQANVLNLPADSKIKAVASGNLDGDTKDEIVLLVDTNDGTQNGIHVYDIDDNGLLTEIAKSTGWGPASDWKGLAVGDIDADGVAEIVAHRNFEGIYRIFKLNGISLFNDGAENFPTIQVQDNIMCFGKFDPSSQNDELVTLRKDGGIVMFSSAKVTNSVNNRKNKNADPCQKEMPNQLFSFLTP
ncbi:VCBS repeat-containing protein [Chryseobacterium arthrosphaerae]|uniref:FG-GAP repeat domain-containing protein n=1 Tax=Chryseobacterium arthrosphaerae TaxID=651561 RepID=UPI0031D8B670